MLSNRAVVHTRFSGPNQRGMIQFVKKFSSQTREVNLKIGIQNSPLFSALPIQLKGQLGAGFYVGS